MKLDLKEWINKVTTAFTPILFNLSANTSLSYSGGQGIYFPSAKIVFVYAVASNSSNMNQSVILATVPSTYRPSAQKQLFCRFTTDTGATTSYTAHITASGNLFQEGSGYARSVLVIGAYTL